MELPIEDKKKFTGILLLLGLVLTLFVFMKFVSEIKGLKAVGGAPVYNTISIIGEGEAFAVSDMATISFTVRVDQPLVSDAQAKVNEQVSNAISKIENVEHVDGNFETDGQIEVGNKEVIAKVMSLNDFNTPVLINGSLPSAKN